MVSSSFPCYHISQRTKVVTMNGTDASTARGEDVGAFSPLVVSCPAALESGFGVVVILALVVVEPVGVGDANAISVV